MSRRLLAAALLGASFAAGPAWAKLPPLSEEAKVLAAAAAAKSAQAAKVSAYALCQVQDRVAARYLASAKAAGKTVPAPVETPPCVTPAAAS